MRARSTLLALTLVLGGCSGERIGYETAGQNQASSTTTTTSPPRLDPSSPYVEAPGEVEPALKAVAALTVQSLMSYDPESSSTQAARQRLVASGAPPEIVERAGPVLVAGAHSAADIVYPQLGGLTTERASVMLVVRQRLLLQDRQRQTVVRTVDVRLVRREGRWTVENIASFGGDPVASPASLPPSAARVLAHPAIDLPDSARWDIFAGRVGEPILAVLAELADRHKLGVTVFATGHPHEVFGTTRVSNHSRGAAVDLWFVDSPVVGQRDAKGALPGVVGELLRRGVTELGAPFVVEGPSGASFTDTVHQDHLHLAIR